ncbi:MAG: hypothetical protein AAB623_00810 [Patescibacteria group bacterium]
MEKDKKIEHKIVETYARDMAEVLENDKAGLIKKIIHGEEKHEEEKENLSFDSKKNKLFIFASFLLIFFASIILFFFLLKKENNITLVENQFIPLILNDQSIFLEIFGLKKEEIIQTVLNEINTTKVKVGGVEGIYLIENKQIIGLRRFISLIKSNFIPGDNTLFVQDNFLLGFVNNTESKNLFILLKVRSATDIFSALSVWEGKMFSDLSGFFGINISADTNFLLTKDFQDGFIENKNARILYDKNGNIVMMYIFADDNSIVITNSQNAAHEIILRLSSSQKKQ